jgi:hypothetical protein
MDRDGLRTRWRLPATAADPFVTLDPRHIELVVDQPHHVRQLPVHHQLGLRPRDLVWPASRSTCSPLRRGASGFRSSCAKSAMKSSFLRSASRSGVFRRLALGRVDSLDEPPPCRSRTTKPGGTSPPLLADHGMLGGGKLSGRSRTCHGGRHSGTARGRGASGRHPRTTRRPAIPEQLMTLRVDTRLRVSVAQPIPAVRSLMLTLIGLLLSSATIPRRWHAACVSAVE